ncbi:NAD(P)-dependent oxidoreductase [Arthrobacter bambusae]|uniref:NAD(P)-dependent oxidoreductase n=1 Tax=Arthrobacter bambusae TaxID=1338426 RepID=UPI001F51003C|nr:NAD(P)-dependent oxidoreductase [Arthrobacter bambusae]MCI0143027.1 NAD(P)-dependent oxidoreductase [Arthrobacter bambusae]
MENELKLGFIGLGAMGKGMAHNLLSTGHELLVHDVRKEAANELIERGARWADSVAEIGREASVIFTSLPGPREMEAVGLGEDGLLASMQQGSVWFDMSTNSPATLHKVFEACRAVGVSFLDAPVSGGPAGASSGKLAIYVGGDSTTFEQHLHLLKALGDEVMYMGDIGTGTSTKLAHNAASAAIRIVTAEVFSMAVKSGVEPSALWKALRNGAIGRTRTFDRMEKYLNGNYDPPTFTVTLVNKDIGLALELANSMNVPMRCIEAAYKDYQEALDRGWGARDSRSPMSLQNERAGVEISVSQEVIQEVLTLDP